MGGQVVLLVEAEMPLAHSMCRVPSLPQLVGDGGTVKGQAVGLSGPDDVVLKACVDLHTEKRQGK